MHSSSLFSLVTVYTDHNILTFIRKMKNKNQKLLRWTLLLRGYNLDIRHIKGKENVVADDLSRITQISFAFYFYHKMGIISVNSVTNIFRTFVKETFLIKDFFSLREGVL